MDDKDWITYLNTSSFGKWKCVECDANFNSRPELVEHYRTVHGDNFPVKCIVRDCINTFKNTSDLVDHCINTHPGALGQYERNEAENAAKILFSMKKDGKSKSIRSVLLSNKRKSYYDGKSRPQKSPRRRKKHDAGKSGKSIKRKKSNKRK